MTDVRGVGEQQSGTASAEGRRSGRRRSDRVVGSSRAGQAAIDQAMVAAGTSRPVRISGPTGVGKKHMAAAIHAWSSGTGPFEIVNCGAVSEALLSREIFGCASGVYPTLPASHEGALVNTAGGTLVLDHGESLPHELLELLGKAIATGNFQRNGDGAHRDLESRIVLTSEAPLGQTAFVNLPHHVVEIPALSERGEDVLALAAHFLRAHSDAEGVEAVGFTAGARSALAQEAWPGNVRELSQRIHQAVRLAGSGAISAEALLLSVADDDIPSFKEAKRAFETRYVVGLLRRCGGNISRAARLAKKDRKDFYDVIRRTGVNPSDFR